MTDFEPQRGKFAGHGIEVTFIRRFMGDRREDMIESVKVNGRPLVVIDPDDREAVERLVEEVSNSGAFTGLKSGWLIKAQQALREFANPKPPKPEEPVGLGAVVEDASGVKWVRSGMSYSRPNWRRVGGDDWTHYCDIRAARVLSEGVTDA